MPKANVKILFKANFVMVIEVRERLKTVELKTDRVITADFVETAAGLLVVALRKTRPEDIVYSEIAKKLTRGTAIKPVTATRRLQEIFPRAKLVSGQNPQVLAKRFLRKYPRLLMPRKLERAARIIRADPKLSIYKVADSVHLSGRTLMKYLRKAGIVFDSAERGRRSFEGKGQSPPEDKVSYFHATYSMDNVRIVAEALHRHGSDRKKALAEMGKALGPSKARNILRHVFPAYMVDKKGIDHCVESYQAWLNQGPDAEVVIAKRKHDKERRLGRNYENELLRKRLHLRRLKAEERVLRMIAPFVMRDAEIKNKELFLLVAADLLKNRNIEAIALSVNYPDSTKDEKELAVVGVRRQMLNYFSRIREKNAELLDKSLALTRFFESFREGGSSPQARKYAIQDVVVERDALDNPRRVATEPRISGALGKLMASAPQTVTYRLPPQRRIEKFRRALRL